MGSHSHLDRLKYSPIGQLVIMQTCRTPPWVSSEGVGLIIVGLGPGLHVQFVVLMPYVQVRVVGQTTAMATDSDEAQRRTFENIFIII